MSLQERDIQFSDIEKSPRPQKMNRQNWSSTAIICGHLQRTRVGTLMGAFCLLIACAGGILLPSNAESLTMKANASIGHTEQVTEEVVENERDRPVDTASAISEEQTIANQLYFPAFGGELHARLYFPTLSIASPFVNPTPANYALKQSLNANLIWQTHATNHSGFEYEIYLEADDSTPDTLVTRTRNPHYDPRTFTPDTQYYWQVVAVESDGTRTVGPIWTFHTDGSFDPSDIETMIMIPEGEFVMGCDPTNNFGIPCSYDIFHYELPLHRVYLDAYRIDKFEVTNIQYRSCVHAGSCNPPRKVISRTDPNYFYNPFYDYYPVLFVSHWDAEDYCEWAGKRLPTEAEWEKAARGSIDTRMWPWGTENPSCSYANYDVRAHYDDRSIDTDVSAWCNNDTTHVGEYLIGASPYGVMNMSGNVFEWVADLYDVLYYTVSPYYNPTGPEVSRHNVEIREDTIPHFVIRGGSYRPSWFYASVAHRHWGHHADRPSEHLGDYDKPFFRNDQVGFRCAQSVSETE